MTILQALYDELVLSYTQSGRVVPTTLRIVSESMEKALDFGNDTEVHEAFMKARDMADVPTQRVLKEALTAIRQEKTRKAKAVTWQGAVTKAQEEYIYAWWHLNGTRMAWLTDDQARATVEAFEADPKNREFVTYQGTMTHVAADNVRRYGVVTMRTRL